MKQFDRDTRLAYYIRSSLSPIPTTTQPLYIYVW